MSGKPTANNTTAAGLRHPPLAASPHTKNFHNLSPRHPSPTTDVNLHRPPNLATLITPILTLPHLNITRTKHPNLTRTEEILVPKTITHLR